MSTDVFIAAPLASEIAQLPLYSPANPTPKRYFYLTLYTKSNRPSIKCLDL